MSKIYAFFTAAVLLVCLGSCNVINPAEPVPTYIRLDSFTFSGSAAFGSSSHDIRVAYVYLNNQSIGIFDLPATIPVILDKPGTILVTPGIYVNGLGGYPGQYPFYRSDTFTLKPDPGKVFTPAALRTNYFDFTRVPNNIDFESGTPFKILNGDANIEQNGAPGQVFEGAYSGLIDFTSGKDSCEVANSQDWTIQPNTDAFIELDYKCTVPFTLGLSTTVGTTPRYSYLVGFYPTNTWKKAYVSIRGFVSTYQGNKALYTLLVKSEKGGASGGYVLLDNIKLVTF